MRKYSLFFLLCLLLSCAGNQPAQPTAGAMIAGMMKKKPWTKSTQSYCAGGSDYFVLVTKNGEEHVLSKNGNSYDEDWEAFDGKNVSIDGRMNMKRIQANTDEISQRPAGDGDFTCQVLEVKEIVLNK